MGCKRCGTKDLLSVGGKVSDCFYMTYQGKDYDGYVPSGLNIGGGDYLELKFCIEFGTIQGVFPINESKVTEVFV